MVTLLTYVCLVGAMLGVLACLAIRYRRAIAVASDTICALSPVKKVALLIMLLIAVVHGGGKTNTQDNVDGGLTNLLTGAFRSLAHFISPADDVPRPPVTPADIAFGWQCMGPQANTNVCYAMPDGAALATNWWVRGAFEDVTPVSNLWAYVWGKVRFALGDTNEIVAVGAPMSAVPLSSRLWSATDTNGAFRITWEDFALGRDTNTPVSAQIEFRANGDYVTRSNEVETVWRHIDPNDFDGDGYLNGDDPYPYAWDDGAALFYGPQGGLPTNCNASAYCDVTVEIDGTNSQWVTFAGDGPSDYADPGFRAKPGVPYDVKILIGKTYRVTCDAPIRCTGRSSGSIQVRNADTNAFTVVWPVSITEAPALLFAPPPGLLGGSHGNTGFTLDVDPYWLDGVFYWTTNTCCQIVDNGGWWSFACEYNCRCGGCEIGGTYTYEGYELDFGGINCGCHYAPDDNTSFGLTAPSVVFKDGALRPLEITFHHGDADEREHGTLTLAQIGGNGKVRIWADEERTAAATQFSWDVHSFDDCTYYLEGVETSGYVGDIRFRLTWECPDGTTSTQTASTTCAEVLRTEVTSLTSGISDGSINRQPFAGHANWEFDVTHSPNPDKHFAVLYRDVVNPDFSVRDFTIQMSLVVRPSSAPVGTASWIALEPTPESGSVVGSGPRTGELRNPKVGGVYHIASFFDGSPTNECNIVLPLAGAGMDDILSSDIAKVNVFASTMRTKYCWFERNSIKFGERWFVADGNGDYLGRPDSALTPSVWYYGMINDTNHMGSVCTLAGTPIRLAKLSNMLAGYMCEKLGVMLISQWISQLIGNFTFGLGPAWQCGRAIANGEDYGTSVTNMVHEEWRLMDDKTTKPWPNPSPADNWQSRPLYIDFNRRVYSPGTTYQIPQ